jgi:hypothetical protein
MLTITRKENLITLDFKIFLINKTSLANINLFALATTIKKQIETVYSGAFGKIKLRTTVEIRPLYTYKLKHLFNNLVIAISSNITNDNVAEADFGGLLIKLNPKHLDSINSGINKRTIPHELGHILGLDHPHARGKFESINLEASLLEKSITNNEKLNNLMCQSWYVQKAGVTLNDALALTENQVNLIFENFCFKKLTKNYHIKRRFFSYSWIGEI